MRGICKNPPVDGEALPGTKFQVALLKHAGIKVHPGKENKCIKPGIVGGKHTHTTLSPDLALPKCLLLIKMKL